MKKRRLLSWLTSQSPPPSRITGRHLAALSCETDVKLLGQFAYNCQTTYNLYSIIKNQNHKLWRTTLYFCSTALQSDMLYRIEVLRIPTSSLPNISKSSRSPHPNLLGQSKFGLARWRIERDRRRRYQSYSVRRRGHF